MLSYLAPAAILALSVTPARGDTSFLQPPAAGPFRNYRDNPIYDVGERIDVQWNSDLDFMDLILWQDYPGAGDGMSFFLKLADNTRSTSMIWPVSFDAFSTDLKDGEDSVFYFSVYKHGVDEIVSTSHYFNVTYNKEEAQTTTTASARDPTSTSAESTPDPTTTTTSATSSGTAETISDDNSSKGLSTGAVAGISVGATLGGLALLGGIAFFAWRHYKGKKGTTQNPAEVAANTPLAPHEYYKPGTDGSPNMGQYPPPSGQYTPSQPSQPSGERSELGDNPWNAPPQGQPRAQSVGGLHEAP